MGILCEINLIKPANAIFKPGDLVFGVIKYTLNEAMDIDKIITSLKGNGVVEIKSTQPSTRAADDSFSSFEIYVDKDNVVIDKKCKIPAGSYETEFKFKLPDTIPSSYYYKASYKRYRINCRVKYYVRIKFERPGWFTFSKHYKKEIYVASGITPKLLMVPVIYGQSRKLMRIFSRKNAIVNIKATIHNSVIPIGGSIQIDCEIMNDTNVVISSIDIKLMEIYVFKVQGQPKFKLDEEIPDVGIKLGRIECGAFKAMSIGLVVPRDRITLQHAKIMQRGYLVRIVATLPLPHKNVVLDIPVEIGSVKSNLPNAGEQNVFLPTLPINAADWEVMNKPSHSDMCL